MHAGHWKTQHVFCWVIKIFSSMGTTESPVAHGSLALCPNERVLFWPFFFFFWGEKEIRPSHSTYTKVAQSHVCIAAYFFWMCKFRWHPSGLLTWITCEQMASSLAIHAFPMQARWWWQRQRQAVHKKACHDHAIRKRLNSQRAVGSCGGLGIMLFTSGSPGCSWSSVVLPLYGPTNPLALKGVRGWPGLLVSKTNTIKHVSHIGLNCMWEGVKDQLP